MAVLEVIRVMLIMVFGTGILSFLEVIVFKGLGFTVAATYGGLLHLGNLLLIFVMYRNKWQFSGWYKGRERKRLSRLQTWVLCGIAVVLILVTLKPL